MNAHNQLKRETLLAKAKLSRYELVNNARQVKHDVQSGLSSTNVSYMTSRIVSNVMPDMSSVFSFLQRYPAMSIGMAKMLLRLCKTRNRVVRTVAMGVASWYVYRRFNKK